MKNVILEACVGNVQDALSAQSKGANQIELCDRLDLDGNTPSLALVTDVNDVLDIPIKVILNPKPFNYHYVDTELDEIVVYIHSLDHLDIEGFVFGPVDNRGYPDLVALERIASATDLPITFHKAIDTSPDLLKSVAMLCEQNLVSYILTSGGETYAIDGADQLSKMNEVIHQKGSPIQIIAAGRISDKNIASLDALVQLNYYHGKLIVGTL